MAGFKEVVEVLDSDRSLKAVFADGRLHDEPSYGYRNLIYVPYAELVEATRDTGDQSDIDRLRRGLAVGRIVLLKDRDHIPSLANMLQDAYKDEGQMRLEVGEPEEFNAQLWALPFQVSFFESISRT